MKRKIEALFDKLHIPFDSHGIVIVLVIAFICIKFAFVPIHWYFRSADKPYPNWLLPAAKVFVGNDSLDFHHEYLDMENVSDRSSAFEYVGYTTVQHSLGVVFKNSSSRLYVYSHVPSDIYDDFIDSDSLGSYYNEEIKGYYDCLRIDNYLTDPSQRSCQ